MLARASAHTPRSADLGGGGPEHPVGMTFVRYLDVCLVLASAPIVLLAKLPTLGYVIGAAGWIVTRFAVEIVKRRA